VSPLPSKQKGLSEETFCSTQAKMKDSSIYHLKNKSASLFVCANTAAAGSKKPEISENYRLACCGHLLSPLSPKVKWAGPIDR